MKPVIAVGAIAITVLCASAQSSAGAEIRTGAGLCLEVHKLQMGNNGARVQVWGCNGQPQQGWTYDPATRAVHVESGRFFCLDVHAPDMAKNGGRVQVWACNGAQQQQWTPLANGSLRNAGGLCLDVHAPEQASFGGRVQVWQCNGSQQQRFVFGPGAGAPSVAGPSPVAQPPVAVAPVAAGPIPGAPTLQPSRVVRIQGCGLRWVDAHDDGGQDYTVVQGSFESNNSQRWLMVPAGGGYYRFMQMSSGRFLDAHEVAQLGFRLVTRHYQQDLTQLWRVNAFDRDYFSLQQASNGRFLDCLPQSGSPALVTSVGTGSNTQTWLFASP